MSMKRWTSEEQVELRKIEARLEADGIQQHRAAHMAERELIKLIERKQRQKEMAA